MFLQGYALAQKQYKINSVYLVTTVSQLTHHVSLFGRHSVIIGRQRKKVVDIRYVLLLTVTLISEARHGYLKLDMGI